MPVRTLLPIAVTLLFAVGVHWWLWPYGGADSATYLAPWLRHVQETGAITSTTTPFGNSASSYLAHLVGTAISGKQLDDAGLIKALALASALILGGAIWHLLQTLAASAPQSMTPTAAGHTAHQNLRRAAIVLVLPTTLINTALLSQADSLWAAACVMALAAAIAHRHLAMLLWCGVALAISWLTASFLPFVLALLIRRRVPLHCWPLVALAWVASLLPTWLAGWSPLDLLGGYLQRIDTGHGLALSAPNLWTIVDAVPLFADIDLRGLAFAAAIGVTATYVARLTVGPLAQRRLLEAAALAPMIVVGLLPGMHDRYFFLADIITLAVALAWPDRRSISIAALTQLGSTMGLLAGIRGMPELAMLGALPMIAATLVLARPFTERPANDNPVGMRLAASAP